MSGRKGSGTDEPGSSHQVIPGLESAAVLVLKQAVELDQKKRNLEALTCYREGIGILIDAIKNISDEKRKTALRDKAQQYMERAERLKNRIEREKKAGSFREERKIGENSCGHSYFSVFRGILDEEVTHIDIEDPYIRLQHQLLNLLRFCELVVKMAPNLESISLTTGKDDNSDNQRHQTNALREIGTSLKERGVSLEIHFSSTLHDREVRFNNGWIVKLGRGLDYFKPLQKFQLGFCDYDLRPCHETTIHIFHKNSLGQN